MTFSGASIFKEKTKGLSSKNTRTYYYALQLLEFLRGKPHVLLRSSYARPVHVARTKMLKRKAQTHCAGNREMQQHLNQMLQEAPTKHQSLSIGANPGSSSTCGVRRIIFPRRSSLSKAASRLILSTKESNPQTELKGEEDLPVNSSSHRGSGL